jgi:hypothetical protein
MNRTSVGNTTDPVLIVAPLVLAMTAGTSRTGVVVCQQAVPAPRQPLLKSEKGVKELPVTPVP